VRPSQLAEASGRVLKALETTLLSERGRWILERGEESRSEWPLEGVVGDKLISGSVDRAFRDEDGRFWIVDFKTSEHRGGNLRHFLDEEQRRYRSQMENYATIVSRMVAGPIWLGLYFPLLDAWREWPFAEIASAYSAGTELAALDIS
jgi:ATP-dependent exoDNAse (exonuclease V) beta subunit